MAMKIQHVFFDLDHILWDFEKNSALTFEKIFLENKICFAAFFSNAVN